MPLTHMPSSKGTLAGAFGAAADAYHSAADVQRDVAARLARRIADLPSAPRPRVLEIGCGTGFLHQALAPDLADAQWLLTDLSEAMVRRARATVGPGATYAVMDGERPALAGRFDLICASLVFQWFETLGPSLAALSAYLAPDGILAFATLTSESFPEWRGAYRDLGLHPAVRAYPTARALETMAPPGMSMHVQTEQIVRTYNDAHSFLAHWKRIGTHVPDASRPPLTPGAMRKLLRRFANGISVTYDVAYGVMRKA